MPLEVLDLEISRDGNKLLIVTGVPNYEIIIFNCQSKERVTGKNCFVPVKQKFLKASFNPCNDSRFFVLYENGLFIHKILPSFEMKSDNLTKLSRIESTQIPNLEGLNLTTALWDEDNRIYVASANRIALYHSEDSKEVASKALTSPPGQLIITQRHILICYKNNLLEWLFKFDPSFNDEDRKPLAVDKYYTLQDSSISEIMYDHYLQEIIIGTQEGYILMIPQPAEANVEDLDDDQAGDKTPSDDEDKKEEKQLDLEVKSIGPFHTSEVVYIKEMNDYDILVSVARDGSVFIWNLSESTS